MVCALLMWHVSLRATSYIPVTFNELVARADLIFVGEVVDVSPFPLQTSSGTIIKSRVIFRVVVPLFGTNNALEVFEFMGGEWRGIGMWIAEMPTFARGDRRVVFARRERSVNPIVGFTQGLLRINRDERGVDRVFTSDGLPLASVESIGESRLAVAPVAAPMRLSDVRDRIHLALTRNRRR